MHPTRSHHRSHFHSAHSPAALGAERDGVGELAHRPSFPDTHLPAIPCTETSTKCCVLIRHRASMLSAAAMAQQHLQVFWVERGWDRVRHGGFDLIPPLRGRLGETGWGQIPGS